MGRNDFLKKIEIDLQNYSKSYQEAKNIPSKVRELKQYYGHRYSLPRLNLKDLFKQIINDKGITYSLDDYFRDVAIFDRKANDFRDLSFDLEKIFDLVNKKILKDFTIFYISIKLYASNFDNIINLLKPMARAIQENKQYVNKYSKKIKPLNPNNSASDVIQLFEYFSPTFFNSLNKFFIPTLRNAIAHEDYFEKNEIIYYYDNKKKKHKIKRKTLLKYSIFMGWTINQFQKFEREYMIKTCKQILKKKLIKKQIGPFLKNYKI